MNTYGSLEHGSTVISCKNQAQAAYVIAWAEEKGKIVTKAIKELKAPVFLSVCSGVVGYTNLKDRALYYKSFSEYLYDIEGY